jgi:hypothetical protein
MDKRRNNKGDRGQNFILVPLLKKTPVKKIETSKTHELKRGKVEVDAPVLCNPYAQGKDNGSAQADYSIEQLFPHEIDHGDEGDRAQNADQSEVEHGETEDPCKKGRNICIKNGLVINVPGGEKRIAQIQDLLCRQIIESLIHPEREGIQRLDEEEKDKSGKKSKAHPGQKVGSLLNSREQTIVQQLFLIPGLGSAPFVIPGRLVGF